MSSRPPALRLACLALLLLPAALLAAPELSGPWSLFLGDLHGDRVILLDEGDAHMTLRQSGDGLTGVVEDDRPVMGPVQDG